MNNSDRSLGISNQKTGNFKQKKSPNNEGLADFDSKKKKSFWDRVKFYFIKNPKYSKEINHILLYNTYSFFLELLIGLFIVLYFESLKYPSNYNIFFFMFIISLLNLALLKVNHKISFILLFLLVLLALMINSATIFFIIVKDWTNVRQICSDIVGKEIASGPFEINNRRLRFDRRIRILLHYRNQPQFSA